MIDPVMAGFIQVHRHDGLGSGGGEGGGFPVWVRADKLVGGLGDGGRGSVKDLDFHGMCLELRCREIDAE